MGHDHDHDHDDLNTFYLDQLFTIAVCGALALVTCLWWWNGTMELFIVRKYHLLVLSGGLLLLVLVVIRAVALWFSVQEPRAVPIHVHDHDHDHGHEHHHHHHHEHGVPGHVHEHGPACGHDHGVTTAPAAAAAAPMSASGHDHDHDHSHGWAPWRYVVLLLPVVLYFLNLPNQGFSADLGDRLRGLSLNAPTSIRSTGTAEIGFAQLQQAALTPESRDWYEGKTVTLTGQYSGDDPKRFTLVRFKIACCAADAVPLNAVIMIDPNATERIDPDKYRKQWIEVKGRVHFFQRPGSNEFITALILYPSKDEPLSKIVQIISPPANPFLN